MQSRCTLLFTLLLACCFSSFAQFENKWVFGTRMSIDFSSGNAVADTTSIYPNLGYIQTPFGSWPIPITDEADASVCDTAGNFLFYTNGHQVWDRNYNLMPNGLDGLYANDEENIVYTTAQGALIVPMPDSAGKYYIFSLTSSSLDTMGRLYYSIVDMSLNNGLGDVDPNRKGILVDSNLREGMTSIVGDHCNIWVVVDDWSIPAFKAFEINSDGLNPDPVISTGVSIGVHPAAWQGCIAASPDGKKIAATQSPLGGYNMTLFDSATYGSDYGATAVGLYDFDPATGQVSNPVTLLPYFNIDVTADLAAIYDSSAYGVCFSPDNSKLYVNNNGGVFYQYDISSGDSATMVASRTNVGLGRMTQMRLGPDGKIYFNQPGTGGAPSYIGCFETPDMLGAGCGFSPMALTIPATTIISFGLPNVISAVERTDTVHTVQALALCNADGSATLTATQDSGWDYVWSNGSTGESLPVTQSGTYWLRYSVPPCGVQVDTFRVDLGITDPPIITVNVFDLSTTIPYDTYQWLMNGEVIPGATGAVYTVSQNGDYQVVVGNNTSECTDTSAIYTVTNATGIYDVKGIAGKIRVYPNPTSGEIQVATPIAVDLKLTDVTGRWIMTQENTKGLNLSGLAQGTYLLYITDRKGQLIKVEKITKQ